MRKAIDIKIKKLIIEDSDSPFLQKALFSNALNSAIHESLQGNAQLKKALAEAQSDINLSNLPVLELDPVILNNHYRLARSIAEHINKNLNIS